MYSVAGQDANHAGKEQPFLYVCPWRTEDGNKRRKATDDTRCDGDAIDVIRGQLPSFIGNQTQVHHS